MPPPVMCAMRLHRHAGAQQREHATSRRCAWASSSTSPSVAPPRSTRGSASSSSWPSTSTRRTSEKPLECSAARRRGRGRRRPARSSLPSIDLRPVHDADAEAGEVVVVRRPSTPGCSAISPPTSAQPACRQPSAMPATIAATRVGVELADRDVVEEEERLGAGDEDVVRAHRDEVDADGVVLAEQLRELELGADAVGAARPCTGSAMSLNAAAENSPPKPPMSPMTSGRYVERTASRIPSTARAPSSMSTPASR